MEEYDEQLGEIAAIENDIQQLSLHELISQKAGLSSRINHLSNEIGDLAFNNFRTYVDAGRTAEHCKTMFSNIHNIVNNIKNDMTELEDTIKGFSDQTKTFHKEYERVDVVADQRNQIWKVMDMPKMMHRCIQSGEYEAAFALTDIAMNLKNSKLYQHELIKKPVDFVIESRHGLLDELFNKFTGPIDLTRSIQVVNNIRKIPYISNTQLRVSILQYRDIYLDSQVSEAMAKQQDYMFKVVDIYRDCMYDTMVLYMAVFPDTELQRRFHISNDPRWERWMGGSQNYLLQAWAHKNLERLFELIRTATPKISCDSLREKLMSFASSFGRMGLDFRLLIVEELGNFETKVFRDRIVAPLERLISKKSIHLVDSDIVDMARSGLIQNNAMEAAALPLDMIAWDDLVVYANEVITGLNDLRFSLTVNQINDLSAALTESFQRVLAWIDAFLENDDDAVVAKRASRIMIEHFLPFIKSYLVTNLVLPLQEKWRVVDSKDQPFTFDLHSAAYEPTPQKQPEPEPEHFPQKLNGQSEPSENGVSSEESSDGPLIMGGSKAIGEFAHSFASHMSSFWTDDPTDDPEQSMAKEKASKTKELNENFSKMFAQPATDSTQQSSLVAASTPKTSEVNTALLKEDKSDVEVHRVEAPSSNAEPHSVPFKPPSTTHEENVHTDSTQSDSESVKLPSTSTEDTLHSQTTQNDTDSSMPPSSAMETAMSKSIQSETNSVKTPSAPDSDLLGLDATQSDTDSLQPPSSVMETAVSKSSLNEENSIKAPLVSVLLESDVTQIDTESLAASSSATETAASKPIQSETNSVKIPLVSDQLELDFTQSNTDSSMPPSFVAETAVSKSIQSETNPVQMPPAPDSDQLELDATQSDVDSLKPPSSNSEDRIQLQPTQSGREEGAEVDVEPLSDATTVDTWDTFSAPSESVQDGPGESLA